jgi:positive regulator of sigma E activity
MLVWCFVLFFLGVTAFLDTLFTFGEIFRTVNSVFFMLISLGLLVRVSTKIREAKRESYEDRIRALEEKLRAYEEQKVKVS